MPVFTPDLLDEIKDRLSLTQLVGKAVKLTRKGREYWGCCPFHHEKTASFTVSDERGAYHCFGCGAHGDIFTFVQETEKLNFVETVERLAQMAGVALPKESVEERKREKEKKSLFDVLEEACAFFEQKLFEPVGHQAFFYLQKRGLSEEFIRRFRLGYAPAGNMLKEYFAAKNIPEAMQKDAGILGYSQQRGEYFDYFRERIIFPIFDKKNRVIAFGGRVLDSSEPKYLNSPETDVFSKGATLYALNFAAESARKSERVIGVEGYMDAISLHAAGIFQAVAPLGTALTERQIEMMWRLAPEPVLCFDNDTAGHNAAMRAAMRALPLLKAGYSLSFVFTPEGFKDPDEFVKAQGKFGFEELVKTRGVPLSEFLWNSLKAQKAIDTPERLADLEKRLLQAAQSIQDVSVQAFYKQNWRNKLWDAARAEGQAFKGRSTKGSGRKTGFNVGKNALHHPKPEAGKEDMRMLMAYILCFPKIAAEFVEDMSFFVPSEKKYAQIFTRLLNVLSENPDISSKDLQAYLQENGFNGIYTDLSAKMELLAKRPDFDPDIRNDIKNRLKIFRKSALKAEMDVLSNSILTAAEDEKALLWEKYCAMQKEYQQIS